MPVDDSYDGDTMSDENGIAATAFDTGSAPEVDVAPSNDTTTTPAEPAAAPAEPEANAAPSGVPEYLSGVSEENRAFAESKGWDGDIDKLLGMSRNAETKLMERKFEPPQPGEEVSDEQWDAYAKANGRPEDATAYNVERPADLPENIHYDETLAGALSEASLAAGLNPAQYDKLRTPLIDALAGQQAEFYKGQESAAETADVTLRREWAEPSTFDENFSLAYRNMKATPGLLEAYEAAGLVIERNGQKFPTSAELVMHHATMAKTSSVEPTGFESLDAEGAPNPFDKKNPDRTMQSNLIGKYPERARTFAASAGYSPEEMKGIGL